MAEIKISQLPAAGDMVGDESIPIVQGGVSRRIQAGALSVGRNLIMNGGFDIWQRGVSQVSSGYGTDDRWNNAHLGTTKIHTQQLFVLGQTDVPRSPRYFSRTAVASVAGAGNYARKSYKMEGVHRLAGEKATLSFWAKADAPKSIAVDLAQNFGSGGAPSAAVTGIGATKFALTAVWQLFKLTVDIPSIAGKVLGTSNNDNLETTFWFDAGANFNARTGALGQQSGTFDIANVKLERGPVATIFDRAGGNTPGELAMCQRYYETAYVAVIQGAAGTFIPPINIPYHVTKRATPALTIKSAALGTPGKWSNANNNVDMDNGTTSFALTESLCIGPANSVSQGYIASCYWAVDAEL